MLKTFRLLTRPTLARRDAPFPKRGRRRIETGGGTDRTPWGRSPVQWILANGKTPPALPTSENLNRYVEDFDELKTKLADVFSIPLEHTFDGTTGCRIQFSRDSPGLVRQPAGIHRIFHRLGHGNGIFSSCNGRIHEYRVRP